MNYSVKAVSKILGVSPNTLRNWEVRYRAVEPHRSDTNRRTYDENDVGRLKLICLLLNEGHHIGALANLTETKLRAMLPKPTAPPTSSAVAPLVDALKEFDFSKLAELLEHARVSKSTREFVLEVVSPLLGKVGELVAGKKLTIAHEHALSALIRDQIGQVLQVLRRDTQVNPGPTFLMATPEGDPHEFGILLAAALCANHGYRAHYLGANLPAEALAIAVKALKPDFVVLGNSPRGGSSQNLRFDLYLKKLAEDLPRETAIWIGGQGEIPHLRAVFGKRKYEVLKSLSHFDAKLAAGWGGKRK